MIIVYTSFDCVARVLGGAAMRWIAEFPQHLSPRVLLPPRDSSADGVHKALYDNQLPLIFWGHGTTKPAGLIGHDRKPAFGDGYHQLLANRLLIGVCCHSCDDLAALARAQG